MRVQQIVLHGKELLVGLCNTYVCIAKGLKESDRQALDQAVLPNCYGLVKFSEHLSKQPCLLLPQNDRQQSRLEAAVVQC